jgi:hypothetical protein
MAGDPLHHFDVNPRTDGETHGGVPQVVKGGPGERGISRRDGGKRRTVVAAGPGVVPQRRAAHVEQKNGDIVRRHAFHYRYDTALELQLLNELYALVRIRFNMFTATKKAIGWRENRNGHKTCIHDKPRTLYQRVTDDVAVDRIAHSTEASKRSDQVRAALQARRSSHQSG